MDARDFPMLEMKIIQTKHALEDLSEEPGAMLVEHYEALMAMHAATGFLLQRAKAATQLMGAS